MDSNKSSEGNMPSFWNSASSALITAGTIAVAGPLAFPLAIPLIAANNMRLFTVGRGDDVRQVMRDWKHPDLYDEQVMDRIVNVLVRDSLFVENWKTICKPMNISASDSFRWEKELQMETLTHRELIKKLLVGWVLGAKKGMATVQALYDILKEYGFRLIAEFLKDAFINESYWRNQTLLKL